MNAMPKMPKVKAAMMKGNKMTKVKMPKQSLKSMMMKGC